MGAYYAIFNHSKKEFIDLYKLGLDEKYDSITNAPAAQLIIHQLVNGGAYVKSSASLIGNWCGDKIEIIPDDNVENADLREKFELSYKDVSIESAKQLRLFDESWGKQYTNEGEEIDLINWEKGDK